MRKLENFILGLPNNRNKVKPISKTALNYEIKMASQQHQTEFITEPMNSKYKIIANILSENNIEGEAIIKNLKIIPGEYRIPIYTNFLKLKSFIIQYNFKEFYTKQEILSKVNKRSFDQEPINNESEVSKSDLKKSLELSNIYNSEESKKELFVSKNDSNLVDFIFKDVVVDEIDRNKNYERQIFRIYKNLEKFDFIKNFIIKNDEDNYEINLKNSEFSKIEDVLESEESNLTINSSTIIQNTILNCANEDKEVKLNSKILLFIIKRLLKLPKSDEYTIFKLVYILLKDNRLLDLSIFSFDNFKRESLNKSNEKNFIFNCFQLPGSIINEFTFLENLKLFIASDFFILLVDLSIYFKLTFEMMKEILTTRNCWLNASKVVKNLPFITELILYSNKKFYIEKNEKYKLKNENECLKKDYIEKEGAKIVDVNGYFDFLLTQNISIENFEKIKEKLFLEIKDLEEQLKQKTEENEKIGEENTKLSKKIYKYENVLIKELKEQIANQKELKEKAENKILEMKETYSNSNE